MESITSGMCLLENKKKKQKIKCGDRVGPSFPSGRKEIRRIFKSSESAGLSREWEREFYIRNICIFFFSRFFFGFSLVVHVGHVMWVQHVRS
jgi:hypothetical protein